MNRVLIIDDNEDSLILLKALLLKLAGCEPVLFSNPLKALDWCRENVPDLLIVDYAMPEMNGLELIREFRALHGQADIPLLMITANEQKAIRYEALASGANDFLTKPIDQHEFRARVRNMLNLRAGQRLLADRAAWLEIQVLQRTEEIRERERELIFRISRAAEFRDPETGAHIQRMAHYSQLIARHLGLDAAACQLILKAAPMHDVGKIGIPDEILLKPGRLDAAEFTIMKRHAELGYELLKDSASEIIQTGAEIALSHHEKFDGSGYPRGLAGEDIPLFGRIVAVADVFDALTSERPYKKAWSLADAREFLAAGSGAHFDPACVSSFLAVWDDALDIQQRFRDVANPLT